MSKYIDAELIEPFLKREEWDTPDERWRPESEFGRYIDAIPTADVSEVRHGRWIEKPFEFRCGGITTYSSVTDTVCSVCGESAIEYAESPYCPWCGAKMDEVGE